MIFAFIVIKLTVTWLKVLAKDLLRMKQRKLDDMCAEVVSHEGGSMISMLRKLIIPVEKFICLV